jgi:predicted amidophosphoribosyltransferase
MSLQLPTSDSGPTVLAQASEPASHRLAICPVCRARVILFSRTFQTYCYRCGLPVTRLDPAGLYYEVIIPADKSEPETPPVA